MYREAWPAERALALLEEDTGTAFDPHCVAALRAVVAPEDSTPAWRATLAERVEPPRLRTPRTA